MQSVWLRVIRRYRPNAAHERGSQSSEKEMEQDPVTNGNNCSTKSKTNANKRNHMMDNHTCIAGYQCDDCDAGDKINLWLKPHINSYTHPMWYKCVNSGKTFTWQLAYGWSQCDDEITQKTRLKVHISTIHTRTGHSMSKVLKNFIDSWPLAGTNVMTKSHRKEG